MIYLSFNRIYVAAIGLIVLFEQTLNRVAGSNVIGASLFILATLPILFSRQFAFNRAGGVILVAMILTFYSTFASLLNQNCQMEVKGFFSIILLWLVLIVSNVAPVAIFFRAHFVTAAVLIISTALNLFAFLGLLKNGLFNEPSHFAMYIIPLMAYRLLANPKDLLGLICLGAGFIFMPSTTLLLGSLFIWFVIYLSNSKGIALLRAIMATSSVLVFVFMIVTDVLPMPDTKERIINLFVGEDVEEANHLNMSSIVWLNGWSQAYQTFASTNGLGLGFNQMGCGNFHDIGYYSPLIQAAFSGDMLNAEDGSLLSAKLISELGYAGLFIIFALSWKSIAAIRDMIRSRAFRGTMQYDIYVLRSTAAISLLIYLFVRSGPYFLIPVILAMSLLFFSGSATRNNGQPQ